jgi:PAS domain S-box-containing protein
VRVHPRGTGFSVYFAVITDRKREQRALLKTRERIRTIFETSPAGIFLVNGKGSITLANRKMSELFSRPPGELIGMPYVDLIHPAERSVGFERMKSLMAAEEDNVNLERRYVTKDGREWLARRPRGHDFGHYRPERGRRGLAGKRATVPRHL